MLDNVEWCDLCATVGKSSKLKIYQINLKEAIKLCEDEACNYPIGIDKLVQRKFEDVPLLSKKKNAQRHYLQPPILSANQNTCLPRPQPMHMSSKAPCNIIRPQPITPFYQPNLYSHNTRGIDLPFDSTSSVLTSVSVQPSAASVLKNPKNTSNNVLTAERDPSHENNHDFHPLKNSEVVPMSEQNLDQISGIGLMDIHSEMDIDTSEVMEVIDVHFSSNKMPAIIELEPTNKSLGTSIISKSDDSESLNSVSLPSSPFIPVRSNFGVKSDLKSTQENLEGINPISSNNTTDNVISQEIEIQTSESPLLGDNMTYFVIEGAKRRRGRPPKSIDEKISSLNIKKTKGSSAPKILPSKTSENLCSESQEASEKSHVEKKLPSLEIYKYFPQWQNEEALCWLDVVLCLFVHSKTIRKLEVENDHIDLSNTILVTLFKAYQQACCLVNKHREKYSKENSDTERHRTRSGRLFSDPEESDSEVVTDSPSGEMMNELCKLSLDSNSIKTGAGLSCSKDFMTMLPTDSQENYRKSFSILKEIREEIWKKIEPRLQCVKGKNDSPVLAIPLMVKDNLHCEKHFAVEYDFILMCSTCGYQQTDRYRRVLPTFPSTDPDFTMRDPGFLRSCFKCNAEKQRRVMKIISLPEVLMLHFAEGLPHNNFKKLQFTNRNVRYGVTGFVQYRNDPDHFVTWIHHPRDNKWIEFDDLKSPIAKFEYRQPDIDPTQIHIVMWETNQYSDHVFDKTSQLKLLKRIKGISSQDKGQSHNLVESLNCPDLNDKVVDDKTGLACGKQNSDKNVHENFTLVSVSPFQSVSYSTKTLQTKKDENKSAKCLKNSKTTLVKGNNKSLHEVALQVRNAKLNQKKEKKETTEKPEIKSKHIIDKVLKSMSEKSNVVFTQKKEENLKEDTDLRKALARVWKPAAETATQIIRVQSKKAKMLASQVKTTENKWEPVNKIELTTKKYRGNFVQDSGSSYELCKPVVTSINSSKTMSKLIFTSSQTRTINPKSNTSERIHINKDVPGKFYTSSDSSGINKSVENLNDSLLSTQQKNVKISSKTNSQINPSKYNGTSKTPSFQLESKTKSTACLAGNKNNSLNCQVPNNNSLCLNQRNRYSNGEIVQNSKTNTVQGCRSRSSSRMSSVSSVCVSEPRITFPNFRRKTFSSFKSASMAELKEPSAPSPTNSTRSEIVGRTKRKLSVDNFITVKKWKPQKSVDRFPLTSSYNMNSTGHSLNSSPGTIHSKENDILHDLYNALDIPLGNHGNTDSMDLNAIENSSCLQDMDDFLDQLL